MPPFTFNPAKMGTFSEVPIFAVKLSTLCRQLDSRECFTPGSFYWDAEKGNTGWNLKDS